MTKSHPSLHDVSWRRRRPTWPARQFAGWSFMFLVTLTAVQMAVFGLDRFENLVGPLAFGTISYLAMRELFRRPDNYPHPYMGHCNAVTLFRAGLVAFLAGTIFLPPIDNWWPFSVAIVAFSMDGFDGWLARRDGTVSEFGARFDMEIDALLGAVLCIMIWSQGIVGHWVFALGFMRYGFVAASVVLPWLNVPLPERFRRKAVCVVQITALIFLICPLAPPEAILPVAAVATVALLWSFATDVLWLYRAGA